MSCQHLSLDMNHHSLTFLNSRDRDGYAIRPVLRNDRLPSVSGVLNGHEYVDLGLSVKWSICYLGAIDLTDFSDEYYYWGATETRMPEKTYKEIKKSFKNINDIKGNPQFDVATKNWGTGWRMPTKSECEELVNKCKWEKSYLWGQHGVKVTGPNGNFIFIPGSIQGNRIKI